MKINFIITIDGKSATGKSLIAKEIKNKYPEFFILDTGNFYRALTIFLLKKNVKINNFDITNYLKELELSFTIDENNIFINNTKIRKSLLFEESVNFFVSKVASVPVVRKKLLLFFLDFEKKYQKIIAVGRDCGSNIFKNANIKFFIKSNWFFQLFWRKNQESNKDFIFKRDKLDENRKVDPLKLSSDSILIKNSFISKKKLMKKIFYYLDQKYLSETV